jgi:NAD(P)-dependent dehydrogenase (short-subunit alcohol dehydrogenase family)
MSLEARFDGKAAVVTGAGRGLGLSFVRALAERGARCVIGELNEALGAEAVAALKADGFEASSFPVDVSQPDQVNALAARAVELYGGIDVWVNNAGIAEHQPSESVTVEQWQRGIGIMLSGVFFGCQAAGKVMLARGGGSIVNTASVNGFVAQPGRAAYCAAKAGVVRLTEVLGTEWAGRGVRVNALAPGVIETELVTRSVATGSASMEAYERRSPTRRLGRVDELTNTFLYLASDLSRYVTGQTLRIDGAWASDHFL